MTTLKSLIPLCVAAYGLLLLPTQASAADAAKIAQVQERIHAKLKPLFKQYYPKAASTNLAFGIHFEYEVKTFEFPFTPRPGEGLKHENPIQLGPKSGGILCTIHPGEGRYTGPFPAPFLKDRKVYKQLLLAPYSPKQNVHLWVSLSYPADTSEEFLKRFRAVMTGFEKDED